MRIIPVTGLTYNGSRVLAVGFDDQDDTVASDVFYLEQPAGKVRRAALSTRDRLEEVSRPT